MGRPDRQPGLDGQTDGHTRQNLHILALRAVKTQLNTNAIFAGQKSSSGTTGESGFP